MVSVHMSTGFIGVRFMNEFLFCIKNRKIYTGSYDEYENHIFRILNLLDSINESIEIHYYTNSYGMELVTENVEMYELRTNYDSHNIDDMKNVISNEIIIGS